MRRERRRSSSSACLPAESGMAPPQEDYSPPPGRVRQHARSPSEVDPPTETITQERGPLLSSPLILMTNRCHSFGSFSLLNRLRTGNVRPPAAPGRLKFQAQFESNAGQRLPDATGATRRQNKKRRIKSRT